MNPDQFKEHMEVCPYWAPPDPRGTFLSLALAGEAGELANMLKKEWRDGAGVVSIEKIKAELFDVDAYAFMLSFHLNVDFVAGVEKALLDFEQRPKYQSLLRSYAQKTSRANHMTSIPDVNDIADSELLQRVLRNLQKRGRSREKLPLWSVVADKFTLGSGFASQLCRRFGLDPDEIVRR